MLYIEKWKAALIVLICALGVAYSSPNFWRSATAVDDSGIPGWLPNKTVSLGLDLQGGVHLLLRVDIAAGVRSRAAAFEDTVRQSLRGTGIRRTPPERGGAAVKFRTLDPNDAQRAAHLIQENDPSLSLIHI